MFSIYPHDVDKSRHSTRGSREGHLWVTIETPFLVREPEGKKQANLSKILSKIMERLGKNYGKIGGNPIQNWFSFRDSTFRIVTDIRNGTLVI